MSDKPKKCESAQEPAGQTDQEKLANLKKLEESDVKGIAGGASQDEPIELPEI